MQKHKKRCTKCRKIKPIEEFWKQSVAPDGYDWRCIACSKEYRKTPKFKATGKRWRERLREEVLRHYGGKCACCGEKTYEFLAIDHIKGGGKKHRDSIRVQLPWWLKKNGYPEGFRVLCHNCNMAMGRYGYCPHYNPMI